VLLVGETGTGKTSVCQLLALMRATHLHVLNCNQHTETSDFLGGFRPTRTRDRWELRSMMFTDDDTCQHPVNDKFWVRHVHCLRV
jgi:MoxR-like ATPase